MGLPWRFGGKMTCGLVEWIDEMGGGIGDDRTIDGMGFSS
jgi:hypothetical protein